MKKQFDEILNLLMEKEQKINAKINSEFTELSNNSKGQSEQL